MCIQVPRIMYILFNEFISNLNWLVEYSQYSLCVVLFITLMYSYFIISIDISIFHYAFVNVFKQIYKMFNEPKKGRWQSTVIDSNLVRKTKPNIFTYFKMTCY